MKPSLSRTFLIALLVASSTFVVHAFHMQPLTHRRGVTTSRVSRADQKLSNIAAVYNKHDDSTILSPQSSHLFAAPSNKSLDGKGKGRKSIRRLFRTISSFFRLSNKVSFRFRTLAASLAIFFTIHLSMLPAWAASSGRAGGSFGRSDRFTSRPAITRTMRGPTTPRIRSPNSRMIRAPIRSYPIRSYKNYHQANGEQVQGEGVAVLSNTDGTTTIVRKVSTDPFANRRFTASDIVLVSGVTAVVANGVMKSRADREKYGNNDLSAYPLGSGLSVWRLTACLNVPNTEDPDNVVRRLQKLAERTSTETRKGLQTLLAEASLELLRQLKQGSISSVESQYDHYRPSEQSEVRAQRQYNRISTRERSKFDKESWSSYNGNIVQEDSTEQQGHADATSSLALVQIHVVIEGNSMKPFGVRQTESRQSLQNALLQLSGDLNAVEDCVLAGEVLWSPQQLDQNEVMTEEDVYASHPMMWPVDYSINM